MAGLLGLGPLSAHAAADDIRSEFVANRTINTAQNVSSRWETFATPDGVEVQRRAFPMSAPGGRQVVATASAKVSRAAILGWGAQAIARALPVVGTAALLYDVYDSIRVEPDGAGGLRHDVGIDPVLGCFTVRHGSPGSASFLESPCLATSAFALMWVIEEANRRGFSNLNTPTRFIEGYWEVAEMCPAAPPGGACSIREVILQDRSRNCMTCDWVDNPNPGNTRTVFANHSPTGLVCGDGSAISADGRCPGGEYSSLTPDVAAQMALDYRGADLDLDAFTRAVLGQVPEGFPLADPTSIEVTDVTPSQVTGPVTTTTTSEGVSTEAVKWDWSRDPLRKNEGSWPKTTTTTKPDGSTSTTTEGGSTPGDAADEAVTQCDEFPDSLGCAKLGEAPTDEVPRAQRDVSWVAESLGLPSGCPADVPIIDGHAFSYQAACDGLVSVRPLIVALGAFAAATIIVFALRGGA